MNVTRLELLNEDMNKELLKMLKQKYSQSNLESIRAPQKYISNLESFMIF